MIGKVVIREVPTLYSYREYANDRTNRLVLLDRVRRILNEPDRITNTDVIRLALTFAVQLNERFGLWLTEDYLAIQNGTIDGATPNKVRRRKGKAHR